MTHGLSKENTKKGLGAGGARGGAGDGCGRRLAGASPPAPGPRGPLRGGPCGQAGGEAGRAGRRRTLHHGVPRTPWRRRRLLPRRGKCCLRWSPAQARPLDTADAERLHLATPLGGSPGASRPQLLPVAASPQALAIQPFSGFFLLSAPSCLPTGGRAGFRCGWIATPEAHPVTPGYTA